MRLYLCLPGETFRGEFVDSLVGFIHQAASSGISVAISRAYSAFVPHARLRCLGGDATAGEYQPPFRGDRYDWILFIDSDVSWSWADFRVLLADAEDCGADVISGLYLMADGRSFAAVERWDPEALASDVRHMSFLKVGDLAGRDHPFPVAYSGLGFTLIRRGVFERLPYPWFEPRRVAGYLSYTSEDASFCRDCADAGIVVWCDPRVVVTHHKTVALRP